MTASPPPPADDRPPHDFPGEGSYAVITDAYPTRDESFYGRAVWPMGEDGDEGLIVQGHGRRAIAAANAHGRDIGSILWSAHLAISVQERWMVFYEDCGCTEDEHEQHAVYEDPGQPWFDCSCERPGLRPCRDQYEWKVEWVDESTSGALPVTEVSW